MAMCPYLKRECNLGTEVMAMCNPDTESAKELGCNEKEWEDCRQYDVIKNNDEIRVNVPKVDEDD
jgi:hypothetical protein